MPVKQDAQKEKEALERLTRRSLDAKSPDAQRKVYEEAYGSYEPTFNKEFELGRKEDRISAMPKLSQLKQQAGDRANELRIKEDANIADAFQGIKDPSLRESLMRRSRQMRDRARENNLGDLMENYQLEQGEVRDDYQRALERALGVEKDRAGVYAKQKEAEALQAQQELEAMMGSLGSGGRRGGGRRGGGGGRRSGGGSGSGKFTRVPNESGGYSFFDGAGNPVTPQEYALNTGKYVNQVLKGSQDMGDQDFLLDYDQQLDAMKDRDLSPEEFRSSLELAYPHIYGKAFDVERQRVPIKKKSGGGSSSDDEPVYPEKKE